MPEIIKISHIAIVVDDLDSALKFWRDALGLQLDHIKNVPEQKASVAFLPSGESEVELVTPTIDDSGIARYLAKRGPGLHHVCFEVDDIQSILMDLRAKGIRLIDEHPRSGGANKKYAFIHPESTGGVLVELYELSLDN
jgi:methylmalonyl-CoA/ethylmalonyl-CoA epimerase